MAHVFSPILFLYNSDYLSASRTFQSRRSCQSWRSSPRGCPLPGWSGGGKKKRNDSKSQKRLSFAQSDGLREVLQNCLHALHNFVKICNTSRQLKLKFSQFKSTAAFLLEIFYYAEKWIPAFNVGFLFKISQSILQMIPRILAVPDSFGAHYRRHQTSPKCQKKYCTVFVFELCLKGHFWAFETSSEGSLGVGNKKYWSDTWSSHSSSGWKYSRMAEASTLSLPVNSRRISGQGSEAPRDSSCLESISKKDDFFK